MHDKNCMKVSNLVKLIFLRFNNLSSENRKTSLNIHDLEKHYYPNRSAQILVGISQKFLFLCHFNFTVSCRQSPKSQWKK